MEVDLAPRQVILIADWPHITSLFSHVCICTKGSCVHLSVCQCSEKPDNCCMQINNMVILYMYQMSSTLHTFNLTLVMSTILIWPTILDTVETGHMRTQARVCSYYSLVPSIVHSTANIGKLGGPMGLSICTHLKNIGGLKKKWNLYDADSQKGVWQAGYKTRLGVHIRSVCLARASQWPLDQHMSIS